MTNQYLNSLMIRAGLSEVAAALYVFIKENRGCSVADAVRSLKWGKSSVYRGFEELKGLGLVSNGTGNWESSLELKDFSTLIQKLENESRKHSRLISSMKSFAYCDERVDLGNAKSLEFLNMEETFQRYLDLSKMQWGQMLVFGNWEDIVNRDEKIGEKILSVEKSFVRNRLKSGGKAVGVLTKIGPYTREIIDFNQEGDLEQKRKCYLADEFIKRPMFVNVFEGNDYVHILEAGAHGEMCSTFANSATFANFYKDFIYSKIV